MSSGRMMPPPVTRMSLRPAASTSFLMRGKRDILVTGGGIIPPDDMETLERQGIGKLFGPGTPTTELIAYIEEWAGEHVSA